jgi:hypothetical protein
MKNVLLITIMFLAGVVGVSAQQSANEGSVFYSGLRQDVSVKASTLVHYNVDTDSNGIGVGYTRYVNRSKTNEGTLGITGELTGNFNSGEARAVTLLGGLTLKARNNERFQPSVRVLAGVARQHVNRRNVFDTTDYSSAITAGVGLDVALAKGSRYKGVIGIDYLNTGFSNSRQDAVRVKLGLVF